MTNTFLAAFLLFIFAAFGGCFPIAVLFFNNNFFHSSNNNTTHLLHNAHASHIPSTSSIWLRLIIAFTGGILLAGGLLHMLPDAKEQLSDLENRLNYPIANLVCLVGFLILYTLDIIVEQILKIKENSMDSSTFSQSTIDPINSSETLNEFQTNNVSKNNKKIYSHELQKIDTISESSKIESRQENVIQLNSKLVLNNKLFRDLDTNPVTDFAYFENTELSTPYDIHINEYKEKEKSLEFSNPPNQFEILHNEKNREYLDNSKAVLSRKNNQWNSFFLFLALIVHSFIEGVAIGTSSNQSILLTSVIIHKTVVAFGLGSSLVNANYKITTCIIIIIIFSLISPIGLIFSSTLKFIFKSDSIDTVVGIFTSLGAGTFLYISIIEMISSEILNFRFHDTQSNYIWLVPVMILAGVTLMSLLVD